MLRIDASTYILLNNASCPISINLVSYLMCNYPVNQYSWCRKCGTILIVFAILFSSNAWAQEPVKKEGLQRVQIIQTDFLKGLDIDSVHIQQLIGNVVLEHNDIIMTCDSAAMFPSGRFEAYGHTVVTSGTTRITGDKISYDPNTNMAEVRGKIVYLTDSTAVLRTTAIDFNTKEEIGFFQHEGTIKDATRLLESKQGYYFSKRKEFEFVGQVQSETVDYTLQSDSMRYNTQTKWFDFYSHTHIWSKDSSYLYCDEGWYDSASERMFFLKNSYLLSKSQEVFADSIYYESKPQSGNLYSNIQLVDTVQKIMALADFAKFNILSKDFELHKNPSVVLYDDQDTLFVRADLLKSVNLPHPSLPKQQSMVVKDSLHKAPPSPMDERKHLPKEGTMPDSLVVPQRPFVPDSAALPGMDTSKMALPTGGLALPDTSVRLQAAIAKTVPTGFPLKDSLKTLVVNPQVGALPNNLVVKDTLRSSSTDSTNRKLGKGLLAQDTVQVDSTYREFFGVKNVKMFRSDFQAVCDSVYFNTLDSIWKMHYNPMLWDGEKMQMSGDSIRAFVKNGTMEHAEFQNNAMIIMPENNTDSSKFFNQIKGKNIFAYFNDKTLERVEVIGNVQSIFFSTSDQAINITEAASMGIRFLDKKVRKVIYRTKVTSENLPLSQTTEDKTKLPGFAWHKDRRPKSKEEILGRELRLSNREQVEALSLPDFSITKRIDQIESELLNKK